MKISAWLLLEKKGLFLHPCMSEFMHGPACHKKILPKCNNHSKYVPSIESCIPTKEYQISVFSQSEKVTVVFLSHCLITVQGKCMVILIPQVRICSQLYSSHCACRDPNKSVPGTCLSSSQRFVSVPLTGKFHCQSTQWNILCSVLPSCQIMSLQLWLIMKERVIDHMRV